MIDLEHGVTKTAVLAPSLGLAKRMAGTNATVNAVLPGPTLSEGVAEMLKDEQARTGRRIEELAAQFVRSARPSSIIRRATTVQEIANLVVYIASPLSSGTPIDRPWRGERDDDRSNGRRHDQCLGTHDGSMSGSGQIRR
ncbi:MAG TPA: SDR family oxidoreductase [Acetobacteraceae bacterium]|nr:SDR family oxidoreductase [Acetobacteraceae bacterium]